MSVKSLIKRYPSASYFIITYTISWVGAFVLIAPKLFAGKPVTKIDGLVMFPLMLLGPSLAGALLTFVFEGRAGAKTLLKKMGKWKFPVVWYIFPIFVIPALILLTLILLSHTVSHRFHPNFFPLGFLFGIPAAFFEEIGWSGFVVPRLLLKMSRLRVGIIVGLFWGFWHLPVIDFLGAATPHNSFLVPFFVSFILVLTAMRILMTHIYSLTGSILLMQIFHAISTGCLVMIGPSGVSPAEETLWYFVYACMLWLVALKLQKQSKITAM